MINNEPKYEQFLLGLLDGSLEGLDRDEAERLLREDTRFAEELGALRSVHHALGELAPFNGDDVPQVDLVGNVMALVDSDLNDEMTDAALVGALLEVGDAWREAVPVVSLFEVSGAESAPLAGLVAALENTGERFADSLPLASLSQAIENSLPYEDEVNPEPALEAALFAVGGKQLRTVPDVDLWSALSQRLDEVDKQDEALSRNIVSFPSVGDRPIVRRSDVGSPSWLKAVALAAAACVIFFAGFGFRGRLAELETDRVASKPSQESDATIPADDNGNGMQLAAVSEATGEGGIGEDGMPLPPGARAKPAVDARPLTLKEVVDSYRHSVKGDAMALGQMATWASLTREEARELLELAGVSSEAVLGATEFLPPEEALAVLQAAVDNAPEDPYLRYALANRFQETNDQEGYRRSLQEWSAADPTNAMPHYLEARMMFASGNFEGGIASVHSGASLGKASTYGAQSARNHAAALEASGYDSDTARFLAATSAGESEYEAVTGLGNDLYDQARMLEAAGDYEGAADLYDAMRVYGEQMYNSAELPNMQLAGIEIQQTAVNAMLAIQQVWTPETLQALTYVAEGIFTGLTELGGMLGDVTNFLASEPVSQTMNYTDAILSGDLDRLWELTSGR